MMASSSARPATASDEDLYRRLRLIRRFEETLLEQFRTGVLGGTTHTCIGQEANAVGVLDVIADGDIVVSNHRCHGHFLAYGGDPRALFAELMGRSTGVCGGIGGSQHLQWRNFYSNGVLGGTAAMATGMALAEVRQGRDAIAVVFLGDGALGEGIVYETLNMAALWRAPVLYVVEDNHIAQTTPSALNRAGSIPDRFEAFGVEAATICSSDVQEIRDGAESMAREVRRGRPLALVIDTCRFGPHSKGDDTRPASRVDADRQTRDPVRIHADRLPDAVVTTIDKEVEGSIAAAFELAIGDPLADGRRPGRAR